MTSPSSPVLRIRLVFGPNAMLGPGKADLLERIDGTGSIAAAGREMGMSYKRAWQLVETMNRMFAEPLVHRQRGGTRGGGAELSETGRAVLDAYRSLEQAAARAADDSIQTLQSLLRMDDAD